MKLSNANSLRELYISTLFDLLKETEDVGMVTSNTFNFPVVSADGEEGWIEVTAKVTKESGDDGYLKREEYRAKCEERAQRKVEKARKDAERAQKKEGE